MKKAKKILLMALALVLVVAISVTATMAYMTSTATVTNTFTVGNVKITLDEAPVDADGKKTSGTRGTANNYKLLPGHNYDKDPTIHVDASSEECWLFVKVEDEIAAIEDATTVAAQMEAKGWTQIETGSNIYVYNTTAKARDNVVVFETFKIKSDITNETLANYTGKTIKVTAFAIQADGLTKDQAIAQAKTALSSGS